MAPIRVIWDPEILAEGFRPSSIFDEAEGVFNTTASSISAPVDVVGAQSTAAAAHPAHNVTGGSSSVNITEELGTIVREAVRRVVDTITTTPVPTTTLAPSWSTTSTTIKRAVERATFRPEVIVEHVSIIFIMIC